MEYTLEIKETAIACDLTIKQDRNISAIIGDTPFDIRYNRISDHQICLSIDGQQVMAWVNAAPGGKTIIIGGEHFFIQDKDLLAQTQTRKKGLGAGPCTVTPPMPAVVVSVPVQLGDLVEKGDPVVVVSAMKMETSLTAPHGGTITRIGVKQGDKVMPGEVLIDIEESIEKNETGTPIQEAS
jgi:biotin carboxyl carrier protein